MQAATWKADTAIECEGILSPADNAVVAPTSEVTCRVADPEDLDLKYLDDSETTQEPDTFLAEKAFVWKAENLDGKPVGEFPKGNLGQEVLWLAPNEEGAVVLMVTVTDDAILPNGDDGSREDCPVKFQVMVVIGGVVTDGAEPPFGDDDWLADPGMDGGAILPLNGMAFRCGSWVTCTFPVPPSDWDTHNIEPEPVWVPDDFTEPDAFTWSANAGSWWLNENHGCPAYWRAPSTPAEGITIGCIVKDDAPDVAPETGSRDDDDVGPPLLASMVSVWEVDLLADDLDGTVGEGDEESPGAYVHFNVDNDNLNTDQGGQSIADCTENSVASEDDLKRASALIQAPGTPTSGTVTLHIDSGGYVWNDPEKGSGNKVLVDQLSRTWDLSVPAQRQEWEAIEHDLWVEGVNGGARNLTLTYSRGSGSISDTVRYSFIAALCGNQPTPAQRSSFAAAFPSIEHCEWSITAPATGTYNCIAWSVDNNQVFYNPWDIDIDYGDHDDWFENQDMDEFYWDKKRWTPTATGPSDAETMYYPLQDEWNYVQQPNNMPRPGYHAARRRGCSCGMGKWIMYESKCGDGERVEHVWDQLNGTTYGTPGRFYK